MILNERLIKFLSSSLMRGLTVLVLLASCSTEDIVDSNPGNNLEEDRVPILFEIGFAPQTRVSTNATLNSTWEDGDGIGVFIVKGDDGLKPSDNYVDNLKLTYNISGTWTQSPLPAGKEYYPTDGESLSFFAYYPYQTSIDPTNAQFSVEQDQSDEPNYNKSELLMAKTVDYRLNPAGIPLNFSHVHALLQIEVVQQGVAVADNDLGLAITEVANSVYANLDTGTDNGTMQGQTVRMYKVPGLTATYRALIPPQMLSGNSEIKFFDGTTEKRIYTGLRHDELTAGKVHKYKITVTDLGL